jgi:hypothetical protein
MKYFSQFKMFRALRGADMHCYNLLFCSIMLDVTADVVGLVVSYTIHQAHTGWLHFPVRLPRELVLVPDHCCLKHWSGHAQAQNGTLIHESVMRSGTSSLHSGVGRSISCRMLLPSLTHLLCRMD